MNRNWNFKSIGLSWIITNLLTACGGGLISGNSSNGVPANSISVNNTQISETAIGGTGTTLNWAAATSTAGTSITYSVYQSTANPSYGSFNSLAEVQAGTLITSGTNITTANVTGLTSGNSYYFNVVATDANNNSAIYNPLGEYFDSALTLFYPFNGNSNDISLLANNGTLYNSPSLVPDRFNFSNSAFSFSNSSTNVFSAGSTQYLTSSSNLTINASPVTLAFWFLGTSGHTYNGDRIISLGTNASGSKVLGIYPNNSNIFAAWINGPDITTGVSLSTSAWQFWVLVLDGTNLTVYENGTQVLQTSDTNNLGSTYPLIIGASPNHDSSATGTLDDVRVWSTNLSSTSVSRLYNVTRP